MRDQIIVIGSWKDAGGRSLRLQSFVANGESFIPIFSDETSFRQQVQGGGFENSGIAIDRDLLASMLHGDELLVLDPGGPSPMKLRKADLIDGERNVRGDAASDKQ
jgi:hypothetical protein